MTNPPTSQPDLDAIEAKAAELRQRIDRKNPWPSDNESFWTTEGWKSGTRNALDKLHIDALLAEVRRLNAVHTALATLANRWQEMADQGDTAIGHFEGPAAATLDAEVGERGRTYRNAADDVRNVLRTGLVPDDLLTPADRAAAPAVAPTA